MKIERGLSENTISSYQRDLKAYQHYLIHVEQIDTFDAVKREEIRQFLYFLKDEGRADTTIARMLSSIRAFHQYQITS